MIHTLILIFHLLTAVTIIIFVLLQNGKGSEAGASFGGGASNTVFGSTGNASFLARFTGWLAAIFFITSLFLGYYSGKVQDPSMPGLPSQEAIEKQQQINSDVPNLENDLSFTPSQDTQQTQDANTASKTEEENNTDTEDADLATNTDTATGTGGTTNINTIEN